MPTAVSGLWLFQILDVNMFIFDGDDGVGWFLLLSSAAKVYLIWRDKMESRKTLVGRVARLVFYPVKSMAGIEVKELDCQMFGAEKGAISDRQFLVTLGDNHTFLTGRQESRMFLIQPEVFDWNHLKLTAADTQSVTVDLDVVMQRNQLRHTAVHGGAAIGLDCGDEVAKWLDKFLNRTGCRLLCAAPSLSKRSVNGSTLKYFDWTSHLSKEKGMNYQDCTPYHLLGSSTVEDINKLLPQPVVADQFRANIIVEDSTAYSEDTWNKVYIGETAEMSIIKLCSRCLMTTYDPLTAKRLADDQPLNALRSYRKIVPSFGESPCVGTQLVLDRVGVIKIGDPIYAVIGPPRLAP